MTVFNRDPSSKLLMTVGFMSKGSWRKAGKGFRVVSWALEKAIRRGSRRSYKARDLILD